MHSAGRPAVTGGPIRVLIVEDQAMFAEALVSVIDHEEDLQVVATASSAREAAVLARVEEPDVVVMDFLLKDGDGLSATREVRRSSPRSRVVMLTGIAGEGVQDAALRAGCCGFVTKTQASSVLVDSIRTAHEGGGSRRALGPGRAGVGGLTAREMEVLRLMAQGCSNRDIAHTLVMSVNTVRCHVRNLILKLDSHSKLEAVARAVRQGILPPV